jgi:glycosyltransferase involved in cell wall biosynthesis
MRELVGDREQREAMGKNAREKVMALYRWDRIGNTLETVLLDVAGNQGATGVPTTR